MSSRQISKKWVFTLNNPTNEEKVLFGSLECAHIVVGREVGENGTPHLQGYVNFRTAKRLTGLKKISARAHWEVCADTEAAINYCKKDGDFDEIDNRRQGQRNELAEVKEMAMEGKFKDIQDKYPGIFWRYRHMIYNAYEVRNVNLQPRNWETEVHVRWGKPGTGKTRFFYEKYPELHQMHKQNGFWSEYQGQEVVLFDDFDGSWTPRNDFLKITDRYPHKVRVLGGWRNWNPKLILITSNVNPRNWYAVSPSAIMRRLKTVTHCLSFESNESEITPERELSGLGWRPEEM